MEWQQMLYTFAHMPLADREAWLRSAGGLLALVLGLLWLESRYFLAMRYTYPTSARGGHTQGSARRPPIHLSKGGALSCGYLPVSRGIPLMIKSVIARLGSVVKQRSAAGANQGVALQRWRFRYGIEHNGLATWLCRPTFIFQGRAKPGGFRLLAPSYVYFGWAGLPDDGPTLHLPETIAPTVQGIYPKTGYRIDAGGVRPQNHGLGRDMGGGKIPANRQTFGAGLVGPDTHIGTGRPRPRQGDGGI